MVGVGEYIFSDLLEQRLSKDSSYVVVRMEIPDHKDSIWSRVIDKSARIILLRQRLNTVLGVL